MIGIRRAEPREHEALTALARRSKAHWGYSAELLALWADGLTISERFIADNDVFCAVDSGVVVGVAGLSSCDDGLELEHLWVEPGRMGEGIGRLLVTAAVNRARVRGATRLRIVADPHAEGFYTRLGALTMGTVESLPPGRMLPVMELSVSG